jgi:hypothetical protein
MAAMFDKFAYADQA